MQNNSRSKYKKVGYVCFFIFQVVYPIIFMIMKQYPAQLAQSYIIPVIVAVVYLTYSTHLTLKQVTLDQVNYVVGYLLNGMIIYFAWNINQLKGTSNNWLFTLTSYISFPLVNWVYGVIISSHINNLQFAIGSVCCMTRLFYYSWQCSKYIRRQNYLAELKDYQLVVQALMIALYSYYLDQLHKTWEKNKKTKRHENSLLESKDMQ